MQVRAREQGFVFEDATIDFDLLCHSCAYNLRGLPSNHFCPECGVPVLETLSLCDPIDAFERYDAIRRSAMHRIGERIGCKEDGMLFVYDALVNMWSVSDPALSSHIRAMAVMESLKQYSMEYFNDREEAVSLLCEWGLHRSEDVSRMLQGMAAAGFLNGRSIDSCAAFAGLFDLDAFWPVK